MVKTYKQILWSTFRHLIVIGLVWGPLYVVSMMPFGYFKGYALNMILTMWLYYLFIHIFIALAFVLLYQAVCQFLHIDRIFLAKLGLALALALMILLILGYSDFRSGGNVSFPVFASDILILACLYTFLESRAGIAIALRANAGN